MTYKIDLLRTAADGENLSIGYNWIVLGTNDELAELLAVKLERYKSGNISKATVHGREITNNEARRLGLDDIRIWIAQPSGLSIYFSTPRIFTNNGMNLTEEAEAAIWEEYKKVTAA